MFWLRSHSRLGRRWRGMPRGSRVVFLGFHHIRDMNGALALDDLTLGVLLALTHVLLNHMRALDDNPLLLSNDSNDPAAFAFVRAGNDHRLLALFYMKCAHNWELAGLD